MHDGRRVIVEVGADGAGLVSDAGAAPPATQVADKVGLTRAPGVASSATPGKRSALSQSIA
jgi:hypothetical protein